MQPAEEPDDFLPSPGAHHSFLPQAGRQALRRGGCRVEGQVGLGAGSMQGWPVPQTPAQALAPPLWDKGSSRASTNPHTAQRGEGIRGALKEGAAAPHQASSLVPLGPFSLLAQPALWAALPWRGAQQAVRPGPSSVLQVDGGGHPAPPRAGPPAAAALGRFADGTLCALPGAARLTQQCRLGQWAPTQHRDQTASPVSSAMIARWPPATSYPPVTSYPSLSQPDLLPIPRSPQPPGGSHQLSSSRQDSDGANSVASYENEEPVCEDEDEDEDEEDYHNEGYLEVLPDTVPASCSAVPAAPVPSNPGLRDSAFSMESGEDYVNVPESEESADASLDGSREYVNVSQELQPTAETKPAILSSQEAEEEEEEGAPDYENLQELH